MSPLGHKERLPPSRLSVCCRFGQETFAGHTPTGEKRRFRSLRPPRFAPRRGQGRAAIRASCTRAWRALPSVWSPSTTSAARRRSTSRKARTRLNGRSAVMPTFAASAVSLQLHVLA